MITTVPDLVAASVERLAAAGVTLEPGLSDDEVSGAERRLGFVFGPEHREFLQLALPVGESGWPDWRNDPDDALQARLDWPIDSVVFDVHNNDFWPASWGARPDGAEDQERAARAHLSAVPRLVPVFSHRCLASDPTFAPSPIFSIYQTDIIFYGDNLLDYVAREFGPPPRNPSERTYVPFWSDLCHDAGNQDL